MPLGSAAGLPTGGIGRSALSASVLNDALRQLGASVGGVLASLHRKPRRSEPSGAFYSRPIDDDVDAYFAEGWHLVDPRRAILLDGEREALCGRVITDEAAARRDARALAEFRRGYLDKRGWGESAILPIAIGGGDKWAFLNVVRGAGSGSFSPAEMASLTQAATAFAMALSLADQIVSARACRAGLLKAFENLGIAAVLVRRGGRVSEANAAAARCFGAVIDVSNRRLRCGTLADQSSVERAVEAAFVEGSATALVAAGGGEEAGCRPFLVRAIALDHADDALEALLEASEPVVLVTIGRLGQRAPRTGTLDVLRKLGLSPAEARVSMLVAVGEAPAAAAQLLGIAEHTARSYLKHAYSKLRICRQSELASFIAEIDTLFPETGSASPRHGPGPAAPPRPVA